MVIVIEIRDTKIKIQIKLFVAFKSLYKTPYSDYYNHDSSFEIYIIPITNSDIEKHKIS